MSIDTVATIVSILVGMIIIAGFTSRATNRRFDETNRRITEKFDELSKRMDEKSDEQNKRMDAMDRRINEKSDEISRHVDELRYDVRELRSWMMAVLADRPDHQKTNQQKPSNQKEKKAV